MTTQLPDELMQYIHGGAGTPGAGAPRRAPSAPPSLQAFQDREAVLCAYNRLTVPDVEFAPGDAIHLSVGTVLPHGFTASQVQVLAAGAVVLEWRAAGEPALGRSFTFDVALAVLHPTKGELVVLAVPSGLLDAAGGDWEELPEAQALRRLVAAFTAPPDYTVGDVVVPKSALLTLAEAALQPDREIVVLRRVALPAFVTDTDSPSGQASLGERPDTTVGWITTDGYLGQALVDGRCLKRSPRAA